MKLRPDEITLLDDMEALQAATRKVIRGLGSAPPDLQDGITLAVIKAL